MPKAFLKMFREAMVIVKGDSIAEEPWTLRDKPFYVVGLIVVEGK